MTDLTIPQARSERDQLASRTDVLDKIGALRMLPDDLHVTTDMVAEFYEVDPEAIRYHVKANREEIDDDGYRVVGRNEFEREFGSLSNLNPRSRSVGLYPRRAVLRLGMLLRDSPIARRVRDMLLDVEAAASRFTIPQTYAAALRAAADQAERAEIAETKVRELAGPASSWKHLADAKGDYSVEDAAKILSRDPKIKTGEVRLFNFMQSIKWINRRNGGAWFPYQTQIENGRLTKLAGKEFWHKKRKEWMVGESTIRITPKGLSELHKRLGGSDLIQLTLMSVTDD